MPDSSQTQSAGVAEITVARESNSAQPNPLQMGATEIQAKSMHAHFQQPKLRLQLDTPTADTHQLLSVKTYGNVW
jgi:hypothetical protein